MHSTSIQGEFSGGFRFFSGSRHPSIFCVTAFLPDAPRWLLLHESSPERRTKVLAKIHEKPEVM